MDVTPEAAARMDGPDVCGGDAPRRVSPLVKIAAMNLPVLATLAAAGHAGYLDDFVSDLLLGGPCVFIVAWYLLAVGLLACGCRRWADRVADDLVFLGLMGTVFGLIVSFSGITPGDLAQFDNFIDAVVWLLLGTGVALYTTLIAGAASFWYGWTAELVE